MKILIMSFVLMACTKYKPEEIRKTAHVTANTTNEMETKYSGDFFGINNGKEIKVTLYALSNSTKIKGVLLMDGEEAKISASESNDSCSGKITENNSSRTYSITMKFVEDMLHFAITFPEYDDQVLTLVLARTFKNLLVETESGITENNAIEKNSELIGTWRFTEVLSSGSGDFYTSFSTDYFVQFKSNGECVSWTGKSGGGSNDVSIVNNGDSVTHTEQWHTVGKTIVFTDINTKKQLSIPYYAEENRMLLKGSLNRIYERIN